MFCVAISRTLGQEFLPHQRGKGFVNKVIDVMNRIPNLIEDSRTALTYGFFLTNWFPIQRNSPRHRITHFWLARLLPSLSILKCLSPSLRTVVKWLQLGMTCCWGRPNSSRGSLGFPPPHQKQGTQQAYTWMMWGWSISRGWGSDNCLNQWALESYCLITAARIKIPVYSI